MCVLVSACLCVYARACMYLFLCVFMCVCVCAYLSVFVCICMSVRLCVCLFASVCVSMNVSVCLCVYVYVCVCSYIYVKCVCQLLWNPTRKPHNHSGETGLQGSKMTSRFPAEQELGIPDSRVLISSTTQLPLPCWIPIGRVT